MLNIELLTVLVGLLLVFYKQLNLNPSYLIFIVITLLIYSLFKNNMSPEGFGNAMNGESAVTPSELYEDDNYYGNTVWDRGLRIDNNSNLWTITDFAVNGNQLVKGDLDVEGRTRVGELDVVNDGSVGGNLDVAGNGNFGRNVQVSGNLGVDDNAVIGGNMGVYGVGTVWNNFGVDGDAKIRNNLDVGGNARVGDSLRVDKDLSVGRQVGKGLKYAKMVPVSDNEWGSLITKNCPKNHFMCGLTLRHENYNQMRKQDNTGVNGAYLKCCPFE